MKTTSEQRAVWRTQNLTHREAFLLDDVEVLCAENVRLHSELAHALGTIDGLRAQPGDIGIDTQGTPGC